MNGLSSGWKTVPLAEVAEIERRIIDPTAIDANTHYVGLEHVHGETGQIAPVDAGAADLRSTKFLFTPNHILYGKLRPYLKKIARPNCSGVCSTDIVPILPIPGKSDRDYLFYYLRQPQMVELANSRTSGANLPRLSPKLLEEFPISVPSTIDEQKRIAAILDKADAIRRERQQAIQLADEFLRSVFLEMFGDPATNPKGWDVFSLVEVTRKIGSGATPRGGKESYVTDGIALIRSLNVHDDQFLYKDLARITDQQAKDLENVVVAEGDVLLNITGASVCRCAIVPGNVLPARVNQHVCIIRPDTKLLTSEFLLHVLIASSFKARLLGTAGASGATREALTKQQIEYLKIPVPPIEVQLRFQQIRHKSSAMLKTMTKQSDLPVFQTLSQRAFRGEL